VTTLNRFIELPQDKYGACALVNTAHIVSVEEKGEECEIRLSTGATIITVASYISIFEELQ
jgi:hypothetical protein